MRLPLRTLLFTSLSFYIGLAEAESAYVSVYFKDSPMQGIEVSSGDTSEYTNQLGRVTLELDTGASQVTLLREGSELTSINVNLEEVQEAEISVTFSEDSTEPETIVNVFSFDDVSAGVVGGIISSPDGEPLADTEVEVGEYSVTTNEQGVYELEIPRGEYFVTARHPDYSSNSSDEIRVLAGLGSSVSITLLPKREQTIKISQPAPIFSQPIEEVVVSETYKRLDTSTDLERFSSNVIDALDVEQLARVGDANVASAITRLVGVTVTGGKFANVRGLDGRYISSTLNGFLMPSTDPLRRDVQLDLFPANILSGVEVQKSYSADLLGTTTGGQLKIKTLGLPDDLITKVSGSLGANHEFTGSKILSYRGSYTDSLGYDSGLRTLSKDVLDATNQGLDLNICDPAIDPVRCTSPRDAARLALLFEDDLSTRRVSAKPDFGLGLAHGNKLPWGDTEFGYYAAANYKFSTSNREDGFLDDPLDFVGSQERSVENVSLNAYLVTGLEFRDEDEILSKTMLLRDTDNKTAVERGVNVEDADEDLVILEWVERQFFSQQFTGKHVFDLDQGSHGIDWRLGLSNTFRYEPDRRTYSFINNNLSTSAFERRWSELDEDSIDYGLDYNFNYEFSSDIVLDFTLGALVSDKDREVELFRFGITNGENADNTIFSDDNNIEEIVSYENFINQLIEIDVDTTPTDSYLADEETEAYYAIVKVDFDGRWILQAGIRQEDFFQNLVYPNDPENEFNDSPLDDSNSLPSILLTYVPSDNWQLRFGWSSTVSYPGLVERSQSTFFDPETNDRIFGNPELVVSEIDNIDFRAEYYFDDQDSVSLALFTKDFTNPIEKSNVDGSGSAADGFTFRNTSEAEVYGIELDASKTFETENWIYSISGNVSFIESEVTLDEDSQRLEGEESGVRDLQGQSPLLVNLQLGFDHIDSEQKFTIVVNSFDDRISRVGAGSTPREIEEGRTLLNLSYVRIETDNLTIKARIKNLLNAKVERSRGGRIIDSYKEGISFSVGATYEF